MIKKRISGIIVICIVFILLLLFFVPKPSSDLKKIQTADVLEMTIYRPAGYYTVTDREDMEQILSELREMKFRPAFSNAKDGMFAEVEISLKNGRVRDVAFLSKNITINGKYYKSAKDYCPELEKIFSGLEKKYEILEN